MGVTTNEVTMILLFRGRIIDEVRIPRNMMSHDFHLPLPSVIPCGVVEPDKMYDVMMPKIYKMVFILDHWDSEHVAIFKFRGISE